MGLARSGMQNCEWPYIKAQSFINRIQKYQYPKIVEKFIKFD